MNGELYVTYYKNYAYIYLNTTIIFRGSKIN